MHSYSKLITFNFNVSSKICQRFVRRGAEQKPFPWGDVTFIFSRFCFVHLSNLSLFSMRCLFQDIPQQMNGSDCGMFACKFAEYITREADINFSQVNPAHKVKRYVVMQIVIFNHLFNYNYLRKICKRTVTCYITCI